MKQSRFCTDWAMLIVVALMGVPTALAAEIIYVDADRSPPGDGLAWSTAYTDLQDALGRATAGDEIWVAAGTYTPGSSVTASFTLVDGVKVFGGFFGVENYRAQCSDTQAACLVPGDCTAGASCVDVRSFGYCNDNTENDGEPCWAETDCDGWLGESLCQNLTVLSGNLGSVRSWHVVTVPATADRKETVLDGFSIQDGHASGTTAPNNMGGGVFFQNSSSKATIRNCGIHDNEANTNGGGVYSPGNLNGSFINCYIGNNEAGGMGGGVAAKGLGTPRFYNCRIVGNESNNYGGGMYFDVDSQPGRIDVVNTLIAGNKVVEGKGGGIYVYGNNTQDIFTLAIANSTIVDNTIVDGEVQHDDDEGGGIYKLGDLKIEIDNSIIWGNSAKNGKQIYNVGSGSIEIDHCNIEQLDADNDVADPIDTVTFIGSENLGDIEAHRPIYVDADGDDNVASTWLDNDLTLTYDSRGVDEAAYALVAADLDDLDQDGNTAETVPYAIDGVFRAHNGDCDNYLEPDMGAFEALTLARLVGTNPTAPRGCEPGFDACCTSPAADPGCERLWKTNKDVLRFAFYYSPYLATIGSWDIEVRELLDDGAYGSTNWSGSFTYSVESGNILKMEEKTGQQQLANQKWYAFMSPPGSTKFCPFEWHYVQVRGDANNDGLVQFADLAYINAGISPDQVPDTDRHDINGDLLVQFADLAAANAYINQHQPPKPSGH